MKVLGLSRYVLCVSVASAMLAGCGAQLPIGRPGAIPRNDSFSAHSDRNGSWMASGAAKDDLLYITNNDAVTVYSYPKGERRH